MADDLAHDDDPYHVTLLITECSRMADRLAAIDLILSGNETVWCRLIGTKGGTVELKLDAAFNEARQLTATLLRTIGQIHRMRAGVIIPDPDGGGILDGLDDDDSDD